jgi:CheY-like chemotaxis protein
MAGAKSIYFSDNYIDERVFFKNVSDNLCNKYRLTAFNDSIDFLRSICIPDMVIPDLVFIDINMPDPNGAECVKILKELPQLSNVPIVIYSVIQTTIFIEEIHSGAASFFIREAYEHDDFADIIKKMIDIDWDSGSFERKEFLLSYNSFKTLQ